MEQVAPDDPAAAAVEGFSTRAALALVATLPADQAEAIVLRVVAGLDVDRVAEHHGQAAEHGAGAHPPWAPPAGRAPRRRRPDPEGGVTQWAPMTLPRLRCDDYPSIRTPTRWP